MVYYSFEGRRSSNPNHDALKISILLVTGNKCKRICYEIETGSKSYQWDGNFYNDIDPGWKESIEGAIEEYNKMTMTRVNHYGRGVIREDEVEGIKEKVTLILLGI